MSIQVFTLIFWSLAAFIIILMLNSEKIEKYLDKKYGVLYYDPAKKRLYLKKEVNHK